MRGESYHQEALRALAGDPCERGRFALAPVLFERERDNRYDPNAWKVTINGTLVGHLAKEIAAMISPPLDRERCQGFLLPGIVRGGWLTHPNYGVFVWGEHRLSAAPALVFPELAIGTWDEREILEAVEAGDDEEGDDD